MMDAVSSVGRTGGLGENRRVDNAQGIRAAQEAAAVEVREKAAAVAVAAVSQPQPAEEPEEPRMETRAIGPVYFPEPDSETSRAAAESEAVETAAENESTEASAEEEAVAEERAADEYADQRSADQMKMVERMSQLVRKLYDLPTE